MCSKVLEMCTIYCARVFLGVKIFWIAFNTETGGTRSAEIYPQIGDQPRLSWPMARVMETEAENDGINRCVKTRIGNAKSNE